MLLDRFFGVTEAGAAAEDIRVGERILKAHPAPAPDAALIDWINAQVAARLARRRRLSRLYRSLVAAAAVIVVASIGWLGHSPTPSTTVSRASIIPAAVWESDDIAADDVELMYFNSAIRQIEAQVRVLESGEGQVETVGPAVDEIEMELIAIETEFWKG